MSDAEDPDQRGSAPPGEKAGDGAAPARASAQAGGASKKRRRRRKKKKPETKTPRSSRAPRSSPRPGGRAEGRRHLLFAAGGVVAVVATAALLLVFGYARLGGLNGAAIELDWPPGLDAEQAAALLEEKELIHSASAMALYLRATGGTADFVPGPHLLYKGASPHTLREMLARSPSRPSVRVVIPDGFHRFDIADRLHKLHVTGQKAFLAASSDPALLSELGIDTSGRPPSVVPNQERTTEKPESAEGYLFPTSYELLVDTEAKEIVRAMVAESDRRWATLMEQRSQGLAAVGTSLGWGRREIVTLASIIQREAMVDEERPIIASVFYNRLLDPNFKPKRRLQSDPTAMYGCVAHPEEAPTCADYHGKPTSAILHDPKNRYSTYMAGGLPPGPISNPGVASLEAALSPAQTKYLFFVAKGGGRHTFSETFDAHNNAIQKGREN